MAKMGYMGSASIGGTEVYLTGSSLNPTQVINAPDVVQGSVVKRVWNWSKIEVGGNVTGPLSNGMGSIWDNAISRTSDELTATQEVQVSICYVQGGCRDFGTCYVNTMEVSVTAGDVAQFSIDFMGVAWDPNASTPPQTNPGCVLLITWDQCEVSLGGFPSDTEYYTCSISMNNNLERLYALNQDDMNAYVILGGFREVSGSIAVYANGDPGQGSNDSLEGCQQRTGAVHVNFKGCEGTSGIEFNGIAAIQRAEASATTSYGVYTYNYQVFAC